MLLALSALVFQMRSPGPALDHDPPTSTSRVAGITGPHVYTQGIS
jgi:hypothetical protein